jgi:hypothetical protein
MTPLPHEEALTRFLAATEHEAALTILQTEASHLLTEAAEQTLAAQAAAETDPARRDW